MSKWKMKLNTNTAAAVATAVVCMRWIERKEISIKHAKNYTINDTSHQKCIAVHLRTETEIIIRRRHRFILEHCREHLSVSVSWALARFLTQFFFVSRSNYDESKRDEGRHSLGECVRDTKREQCYLRLIQHSYHKFAASEKICSQMTWRRCVRFCRPKINQLITRNLQSNHLHGTNANGDDIDFITRAKKNVWICIFPTERHC